MHSVLSAKFLDTKHQFNFQSDFLTSILCHEQWCHFNKDWSSSLTRLLNSSCLICKRILKNQHIQIKLQISNTYNCFLIQPLQSSLTFSILLYASGKQNYSNSHLKNKILTKKSTRNMGAARGSAVCSHGFDPTLCIRNAYTNTKAKGVDLGPP